MQCPTAKLAFFDDCVTHDFPPRRVEQVRLLRHLLLVGHVTLWAWFHKFGSSLVVVIVDRAGSLTMEPGSISRERDEISKGLIAHSDASSILFPSLRAGEGHISGIVPIADALSRIPRFFQPNVPFAGAQARTI